MTFSASQYHADLSVTSIIIVWTMNGDNADKKRYGLYWIVKEIRKETAKNAAIIHVMGILRKLGNVVVKYVQVS